MKTWYWICIISSMAVRTRAQESRAAIQRLYIAMQHLFLRGSYKPLGVSGEAMIKSLLLLKPEIYGSIADPEKVELSGLLYVFQRLPEGIEQCRFINLIAREGLEHSSFVPLIPSKRRRDCYRVDDEQMYIEMTRGRSDIYDVLTHLTFMFVEAEKIRRNSFDYKDRPKREWLMLEEIVKKIESGEAFNEEIGYTYLSTILGRTYEETQEICEEFADSKKVNSLFEIAYWLGKRSIDEHSMDLDREITFSSALRENVGNHMHGEMWANDIKKFLLDQKMFDRPIHIVSANMHSVMNTLYAKKVVNKKTSSKSLVDIAKVLSQSKNDNLSKKLVSYASANGMTFLKDDSGTNIGVQIFDLCEVDPKYVASEVEWNKKKIKKEKPLLLVFDYPFGEQAYEIMDELLKPYDHKNSKKLINVASINIMGKAGILEGGKGDIMIPNAHIFEGTADNYPFENKLVAKDFKGQGVGVYAGPMITVLGTSLQNKDILRYFHKSSWKVIGLEMEGAHFQKAIQVATKIRNSINPDAALRYAYYASDNPLETGSTLASGSLGLDGVRPTYLITSKIISGILS